MNGREHSILRYRGRLVARPALRPAVEQFNIRQFFLYF